MEDMNQFVKSVVGISKENYDPVTSTCQNSRL